MPTQPLVLALAAGAFYLASVVLLMAAPSMMQQALNAATCWLGHALRGDGAALGANAGRDGAITLPRNGLSGRWMLTPEPATGKQMPRPWTREAALATWEGEGGSLRAARLEGRRAGGVHYASYDRRDRRRVTPRRSQGAWS